MLSREGSRGITLIELMIVVAIVGILASIAYPSYRENVNSGRRSDGQGALVNVAQRLERCFTQFNAYDDARCSVANDLTSDGLESPDGFYLITAAFPDGTRFTLSAAPQGPQTADTRCGTLTLTHSGARNASGTQPDRCW